MLEMMPLAHVGFDAATVHACEPTVFAFCRGCGRRVTWCQMSTELIRSIVEQRFVCDACTEIGR